MQVSTAVPESRQACVNSTALIHTIFVPTGIVTVMLGPLLPLLAARWSLNDTRAGYLLSAQFLGALLGTFVAGAVLTRWGFRGAMALGQLLMAVGVGSLIAGGFATALAAAACYGAGIGFTIPAGNLAVAELNPERRSSSLNLLNFSWSAGAVACPFLLVTMQRLRGTDLFLYGLAAVLVALALALRFLPNDVIAPATGIRRTRGEWRVLGTSTAILLGLLFFVYVGTENALGGWLASYAKRMNESSGGTWMLVSSYFYGALLLGRALAPLTSRRLSDATQAAFGVALALFSSTALILSRSMPVISGCAFLAGLGLAAVYPITIAFLSAKFGDGAKSIAGFMFALSTIGGASFPLLVGSLSTWAGSLRSGLLVPVLGCLLMFAIFTRPRWRMGA